MPPRPFSLSRSPIADDLREGAPVIPCPPAQRSTAIRALLLRVKRMQEEIGHCATSAREVGLNATATSLDAAQRACDGLILALSQDPR